MATYRFIQPPPLSPPSLGVLLSTQIDTSSSALPLVMFSFGNVFLIRGFPKLLPYHKVDHEP